MIRRICKYLQGIVCLLQKKMTQALHKLAKSKTECFLKFLMLIFRQYYLLIGQRSDKRFRTFTITIHSVIEGIKLVRICADAFRKVKVA